AGWGRLLWRGGGAVRSVAGGKELGRFAALVQHAAQVHLPRAPALVGAMRVPGPADVAVPVQGHPVVQVADERGDEHLELPTIRVGENREAGVDPDAVGAAGGAYQVLDVAARVLRVGEGAGDVGVEPLVELARPIQSEALQQKGSGVG